MSLTRPKREESGSFECKFVPVWRPPQDLGDGFLPPRCAGSVGLFFERVTSIIQSLRSLLQTSHLQKANRLRRGRGLVRRLCGVLRNMECIRPAEDDGAPLRACQGFVLIFKLEKEIQSLYGKNKIRLKTDRVNRIVGQHVRRNSGRQQAAILADLPALFISPRTRARARICLPYAIGHKTKFTCSCPMQVALPEP